MAHDGYRPFGITTMRHQVADAIDHGRMPSASQTTSMAARLAEAAHLEQELSRLVNQAYDPTAEDEKLLWQTAPPRMPVAPPQP